MRLLYNIFSGSLVPSRIVDRKGESHHFVIFLHIFIILIFYCVLIYVCVHVCSGMRHAMAHAWLVWRSWMTSRSRFCLSIALIPGWTSEHQPWQQALPLSEPSLQSCPSCLTMGNFPLSISLCWTLSGTSLAQLMDSVLVIFSWFRF